MTTIYDCPRFTSLDLENGTLARCHKDQPHNLKYGALFGAIFGAACGLALAVLT